MAFYFDKQIIANSKQAKSQFGEVTQRRQGFVNQENAHGAIHGQAFNAAARIPQDVYRDFDNITKRLMTGDEGGVILNDLLPLARSVHIGKIVSEYRRVSDSGRGQSSITGQLSKPMDHAVYDYDGTLVLIHDDSFGRTWREVEAMRSEDFDALMDDQENAVRAVRRQMVANFMTGSLDEEGNALNFKGTTSYGIKNSPNTQPLDLGAGGLNTDLTSASITYADFEKVFVNALSVLQGSANNVETDITFYVSSEIWFNMLRKGTNDSSFSTILEALRNVPGVADIKRTNGANALTGNEFIAVALSSQYIQPVVGMGVSTTPILRTTPYDDLNYVTWGAAGLLVKADAAGRSGVLYASA